MNLNILIAEDHLIVREGLRTLISRQDDMEIVGEADNGKTAVEKAKELKPDVIIITRRIRSKESGSLMLA